ncbi:hypothetical protein [Kitasatospora sp. NPDC093558]|uniref:hypothetical protein n=1 Tax=Kitasatospora sp. NPDC093558 TaxID=3155201 RepID=UPI0034253DFD
MSAPRGEPDRPWLMLDGRVSLLKRNLERASDLVTPTESGRNDDEVDVWGVTFANVREKYRVQKKAVEGLQRKLALKSIELHVAWQTYMDIQRRSEEAFRECLALLSGLAVRDRMSDQQACVFADELIRNCLQHTQHKPMPALPLHGVTFSIIRHPTQIRFPEWDIWTLPLVAHGLGQARNSRPQASTMPNGCASSSPTRSEPTRSDPPTPVP